MVNLAFLTTWEYDSWNRFIKMHYPDGEELTYSYDSGGNMTTMKAEKGSHNYNYINQTLYDK